MIRPLIGPTLLRYGQVSTPLQASLVKTPRFASTQPLPVSQTSTWGQWQNWLNRISDRPRKLLEALALPYRFNVYGPTTYMVHSSAQDVQHQIKTRPRVVLGDLHGSWYKLLETLVTADLISMPPKTAHRLRACHEELETLIAVNPTLSASVDPANHHQAQRLLKEIKHHVQTMRWKDENRQLLLLGDVIADRSGVDSITLDLIHHFNQHNPNRIWHLVGNHDHGGLRELVDGQNGMTDFSYMHYSMDRALNLATDKPALQAQYLDFLQEEKLMVYNPSTRTLFTHAPNTVKDMIALITTLKEAEQFSKQREYAWFNTPDRVAYLADEANMFYTQYVKTGREQGHLDRYLEGVLGFLRNFMARSHTLQNPADLPFANQGVIRLVHGHTPETRLSPFYVTQRSRQHQVNYEVVSLDQTIRKTTDPLTERGEASLLYVDG